MKFKFLFMILIFFIVIISIIGCIENNRNFEDDEISFDYPSNWETGRVMDLPGAIISVRGNNTEVIISKKELNNNSSLKQYFNNFKVANKENLTEYCYQIISEKTLQVDDTNAYEIIYKIGCNNTQTRQQHLTIFMEKNGYLYTISCTVIPPEEFDNQKGNIDIIIESFQVK
ncbi:MAG: PsbP-related protein [Methanomicrobiales archaeon]